MKKTIAFCSVAIVAVFGFTTTILNKSAEKEPLGMAPTSSAATTDILALEVEEPFNETTKPMELPDYGPTRIPIQDTRQTQSAQKPPSLSETMASVESSLTGQIRALNENLASREIRDSLRQELTGADMVAYKAAVIWTVKNSGGGFSVSFSRFNFRLMVLVVLMASSFSEAVAGEDVLPIPDNQTYRAFLLDEWKPSTPSVVMMVDPFCPYCIRTLQKKDQLREYNVFLFWSPILGPASEQRVAQILNCEGPASSAVIYSVIKRKAPECKASADEKLSWRNSLIVDAYNPDSVPAYYFGGRRVSLQQLDRYIHGIKTLSGATSVDWERYGLFRVAQPTNGLGQVGVLLPRGFEEWGTLIAGIRSTPQFKWHLFPYEDSLSAPPFCSAINSCERLNAQQVRRRRGELMLLFDVKQLIQPRFILNDRLLTPEEARKVLGIGDFHI